jgi:hypothetical protein
MDLVGGDMITKTPKGHLPHSVGDSCREDQPRLL